MQSTFHKMKMLVTRPPNIPTRHFNTTIGHLGLSSHATRPSTVANKIRKRSIALLLSTFLFPFSFPSSCHFFSLLCPSHRVSLRFNSFHFSLSLYRRKEKKKKFISLSLLSFCLLSASLRDPSHTAIRKRARLRDKTTTL